LGLAIPVRFRLCRQKENIMIGHRRESGGSPVNGEATKAGGGMSRRDFVKYSTGTFACIYLCGLPGCGS
jgi:hypothetical protein